MSKQQNAQAPEENSKMDALIKVVLVFFISLLSFSVGTFVGKQVSDSDHRRASLEGETSGHEEVAAHETSTEETATHEVTEQEVEDLASEFVQGDQAGREVASEEDGYTKYERHDTAKEAPKEETGEKHAEEQTKASPVMAAAEKVSQGEAPTSGKKVVPARKPSNALPAVASSSIGKYTVQVASFATESEAKHQASTLKSKGWSAFYIPAEVKGKTWYRVSIGMFEESENAQAFMKKYLHESGAKDALVTKIVQ